MPDLGPLLTPRPQELEELVRGLHAAATPWCPAGLGHHAHWGPPLQQPCTLVSTRHLNRIRDHAVGDFTVTVEAGLSLAALQQALAAADQWLPVDPPLAGDGSIGGIIARGLGGRLRHRYMGLRDQLIGIELIAADGTLARAGGRVVKNVAGYDLMRLFCGSWGSLGLITAVTLRTQPLPRQRRRLAAVGPAADLALLRQRLLLESPLSLELLDWQQSAAAVPRLLIGLVSLDAMALACQEEVLRELLPAGLSLTEVDPVADPGTDPGTPDRRIPPGSWLLRPAVPPVQALDLLTDPAARGWSLQLGAASGLGLAEADFTTADDAAVDALRSRCRQRGGLLTILQAPPACRLPAWHDAPARVLIEAVKRQFDPLGQLAPGRLPGVQSPKAATV